MDMHIHRGETTGEGWRGWPSEGQGENSEETDPADRLLTFRTLRR